MLNNYRPASNLKKVVIEPLEFLSGYPDYTPITVHSTESILLEVHQDIAEAFYNKFIAGLVLLDSAAAFDVIDHRILQKRLEHPFGLAGSALSWIQSRLSDRTQYATLEISTREVKYLHL